MYFCQATYLPAFLDFCPPHGKLRISSDHKLYKSMKNDVKKKKPVVAEHGATADESQTADVDFEAIQPHQSWHVQRLYIALAAIFFAAVAGGWFACSAYRSHFSVGIGGTNISAHSSNAALAAALDRQTESYRLTINYPNSRPEQFRLQQLGLQFDTTASLQATRVAQHRLVNRLRWWRPIPAVLVFHEDTDALNNFIAGKINKTMQPSKDAQLTIVKGVIQLTNATAGRQYGLTNPKSTLLAAARSLQPKAIKLQTLQINPALTASILEPYKAKLTKAIDQPASFTIGGQTVKPPAAQIASWLDITPNDKTKKVSITVNSGKVAAYINSIAANAIRPPRDQVDITRADGSVQVLVAGIDGVSVVNESGAATNVAKNLLSGKGFSISLPVGAEPFQIVKTSSYPKWIEVDLTNKVLYAYQYDKLIKTYLVSAGAPDTPTVTGQFKIYSKFVQQNMYGSNVDGSSYFQPNVPWVNYFYSDFAIHGNYWRPVSYFGHVNSSHGCVGLLDDDAEWIYNWAPIGTPVVIHT